ncbi:6409_t:CDS:2 [Ambispora leptoticha]|uniref:6409_t:CDS:1 n=1 Tax=Ambispora leptoticha TaxID=144679 RepID=A0A9N9B432_9GLOM|nr:6409_t:CDS:2 [Ambispora leptoticha]
MESSNKVGFLKPENITLNDYNNGLLMLTFTCSLNCNHEFLLDSFDEEYRKKFFKKLNTKVPNKFLLFRTLLSVSIVKDLHCTEQSCPLFNIPDHLQFISKLSSHIYKDKICGYMLSNYFNQLYEELTKEKSPNNLMGIPFSTEPESFLTDDAVQVTTPVSSMGSSTFDDYR